MRVARPGPLLAPFIELLWHSDDGGDGAPRPERERVLPTGRASLVVRVSPEPVRVFAADDEPRGRTFGHAVVGGARSSYYVRDTSRPSIAFGVQFRPGGAAAFLGVPAEELAERHTSLDDLWGSDVQRLRERLLSAPSAAEQFTIFAAELAARARRARAIHPAVAAALRALGNCNGPAAVDEAWRASGFSRRHFIAVFQREVGLSPKVFARIQRFQGVLRSPSRTGWADRAAAGGYADQSHLVREFRALAGVAPSRYRPHPGRPNHVPLGAFALTSNTSKPRARARG